MGVYRRSADWSVGYWAMLTLDSRIANYSGWNFAAKLAKTVGDPDGIQLGMAASPTEQGFYVIDGPSRLVSLRILPVTIQSYPDSSGTFELFANVLAAPLGGERFHAFDLVLNVVRGPTP